MMERLHTTNLKPGSVGYIQKVTQTRAMTRNRRSSTEPNGEAQSSARS